MEIFEFLGKRIDKKIKDSPENKEIFTLAKNEITKENLHLVTFSTFLNGGGWDENDAANPDYAHLDPYTSPLYVTNASDSDIIGAIEKMHHESDCENDDEIISILEDNGYFVERIDIDNYGY